jgi:hypothetical protein
VRNYAKVDGSRTLVEADGEGSFAAATISEKQKKIVVAHQGYVLPNSMNSITNRDLY